MTLESHHTPHLPHSELKWMTTLTASQSHSQLLVLVVLLASKLGKRNGISSAEEQTSKLAEQVGRAH